jgi:uncharacterized membrane protein YhaH (DUF805 family)
MFWDLASPIWFCMMKYATMKGRADRAEYWAFSTFVFVVTLILGEINWFLALVFTVATLMPSLAVSVRRLHDTNRSGWLLLLFIVPFVNLVLLLFLAQRSVDPNSFGRRPRPMEY